PSPAIGATPASLLPFVRQSGSRAAAGGRAAAQPNSYQQIVQCRAGAGGLGQRARSGALLEELDQPHVLALVKGEIAVGQRPLLGAAGLAGDQLGKLGEAEVLVERDEVGLDLSAAHQVDAGQTRYT